MHYLIVICLLTASNLVMTTAWYWHIKPNNYQFPLWQIILISWGIALLEYCLAVPANHLGAHWGDKTVSTEDYSGSSDTGRIYPVCDSLFKR